MDRRTHPRFAINLKAALLQDHAMPMGIRVRDVSAGGMLLQYEQSGNSKNFAEGDRVEVRLSLKQDHHRKTLPLPMTVRRVEENGIGAQFAAPQAQLMTLLEPYLLDREKSPKTEMLPGELKATGTHGSRPSSADVKPRAERRRYAIKRARAQMSDDMKSRDELRTKHTQTDNTGVQNGERKLFYVGLLSIATAIAIVVFDYNERFDNENRLQGLESAVSRQADSAGLLREHLDQADAIEQELAGVHTRMDSLAASFAALETRVMQASDKIPTAVITDTSGTGDTPTADNSRAEKTPVEESLNASSPPAETPQADPGPWVINLVSLNDEASANAFIRKAQALGIRAASSQVTVKGDKVWRVQVDGFTSRNEAGAYGETSRHKLGLDSVWIYRNSE